MFLLLFIVFLIQFFTYWIFEPLASFLEYFLENNEIKTIKAITGNNLISRTYSKTDARGSNIQ